jgi:hypothetical protein
VARRRLGDLFGDAIGAREPIDVAGVDPGDSRD